MNIAASSTARVFRDQDAFDIIAIKPGIHFALAHNVYKTNCNSLIVEGDEDVVVVDTQATSRAASVLRDAIAERLRKPISYVINTHHHWDHWQGNAAYLHAAGKPLFLSTDAACLAMQTAGLAEIRTQLARGAQEIGLIDALIETSSDDGRVQLMHDRAHLQAYLRNIADFQPVFPTLTFSDRLTIHLPGRVLELRLLGPAHSNGDLIVHLPHERIVFCGDIIIGWTPWLDDGMPSTWIAAIDKLLMLDFDTLLMGHGAPTDKSWANFIRQYICDLVQESQELFDAGVGLSDATERVIASLAPSYEKLLSEQADRNHSFRSMAPANVARVHDLWLSSRSRDASRGRQSFNFQTPVEALKRQT